MKSLIPFKRGGTAAALEKARGNLVAGERRLGELRDRRAALLLADDTAAEVAAVDREIGDAQRAMVANTDRISALADQLRIERREDLQRQRDEQIAEAKRLLDGRTDAGKAVQAALERLGDAIGRLYANRDSILSAWPEGLPLPRHDDLKAALDKEIAWTLFSAGKVPATGSLNVPRGLEVLSIRSVVATVASEHAALIERLKNLPIENEEAA
jgi:hypothetical protein